MITIRPSHGLDIYPLPSPDRSSSSASSQIRPASSSAIESPPQPQLRDKSRDEIARLVDREAGAGPDLVILPETWLGQAEHPETIEGQTITTFSALARKHRTYLVCPIDRRDGKRRLNSAVLLDRAGKVAGIYDKVFPYWSEFDLKQPVCVGDAAPVFQTDFGKLGLAICFDVNFPEVWQRLAEQGAELVVWPSAYSAGTSLQAHALNHHFYIVTSTGTRDCVVYDITGEELHYSKSQEVNIARVTLDLDRGIYHQNFNMDGRDKLLKERGQDVRQRNGSIASSGSCSPPRRPA
jgi:predicted amidohydrolase